MFAAVDEIGELRREHFVDERAIVRRLERRGTQDHVGLHRRVAVVEVDEGLRRALPAADNGDLHRLATAAGLLGHVFQVLAVVEHPAVALERTEHLRDTRGAAGTDHQGAGGAHQLLAVGVARDHPQRLDLAGAQHRLNAQDLFAVAALLLEVAGDPAQVVVELHPAGIEGAQVDEVDQAIVLVQVVDEGIRAGGVAQGHQVLEEGDLQLALRHQGVAVPAVVALLVQEQHFQGALRLGPFLEGNRQGDIGRAEADTDEIVNHGGCSCLSHFQFLWIGPLSSGSDKSRAALEGHLLTRNEDREMKFKRCRARISEISRLPIRACAPDSASSR